MNFVGNCHYVGAENGETRNFRACSRVTSKRRTPPKGGPDAPSQTLGGAPGGRLDFLKKRLEGLAPGV